MRHGRWAPVVTENTASCWSDCAFRSVDLSAGTPQKLSDGRDFVLSPTKAQIALRESPGDARLNRLRLVALDAGADLLSFTTDGSIADVQFLPDGRGIVFLDMPASGPRHLRFISPAHPDSVELAQWTDSILSAPVGPFGSYPIDPTGCFTIADTDLAPGPGTRLVLLPE